MAQALLSYLDAEMSSLDLEVAGNIWGTAFVDGTKFYVGLKTRGGQRLYVLEYDVETKIKRVVDTVRNTGTNDDHACPSIFKDKDGYFWLFYSHASAGGLYYIRSTSPNQIDTWGSAVQVRALAVGTISYPCAFQNPTTGRIYIMYMFDPVWQISYADPPYTSWTHRNTIVPLDYYSDRFWNKNSRTLHVASTGLPVDTISRANIYYCKTDDYGASWKDSKGQSISSPQLVWTGNCTRTTINLGDDGKPYILMTSQVPIFDTPSSFDAKLCFLDENNNWLVRDIPDQQTHGWSAQRAVVSQKGLVHVFVWHHPLPNLIWHYYSSYPFIEWTGKTNISATSSRHGGQVNTYKDSILFLYTGLSIRLLTTTVTLAPEGVYQDYTAVLVALAVLLVVVSLIAYWKMRAKPKPLGRR